MPRQMRSIHCLVTLCIALFLFKTAAYAVGAVQVTYNDGGTVASATEGVTLKNGIIEVNTDTPVKLLITPNEGYTIHSVFRDGKQMNLSGTQPQTITVRPKGDTSIDLQVTFIPLDLTADSVQTTAQSQSHAAKRPVVPPAPDIVGSAGEDTSTNAELGGVAIEQMGSIAPHVAALVISVFAAIALTIVIMVRIFRKSDGK